MWPVIDRRPTLDWDSPRRKNGNAVSNPRIRACSPTSSGPPSPLHDISCTQLHAGTRGEEVLGEALSLFRARSRSLGPAGSDHRGDGGCNRGVVDRGHDALPFPFCPASWAYFNLKVRPELAPGPACAYTLVVLMSAWPSVADTSVIGAPLSMAC